MQAVINLWLLSSIHCCNLLRNSSFSLARQWCQSTCNKFNSSTLFTTFQEFVFFETLITKFSTKFPRELAKIPSQSRSRQNIYLSELTNEYWSMKHERKKSHWNFPFRCFGGVAQTLLFVCIGLRFVCSLFVRLFLPKSFPMLRT